MPDPVPDPQNQNQPAKKPQLPIALWIVLLFVAALLIGIMRGIPVIQQLSDQAFARGLITFIISISTIGLAFFLAYQAFSEDASDERFRRAREIFTGLMGVLGTIVGFYFGAADKGGQTFEIADLRFSDKQLMTHANGGARPFRYSITSSDKAFKSINDKPSEDGWILETLDNVPKPGSTLTVEVSDSKAQKISKTLDIPGGSKPSSTPQPTPTPSSSTTPLPITTPTPNATPKQAATPPASTTPVPDSPSK